MSSRCQVRVTVGNISEGEARAVRKALEPDNVNFPKGLSLEIRTGGGEGKARQGLVLDFGCAGGCGWGSLVGTVDEVLGHVQAALGAVGAAERC